MWSDALLLEVFLSFLNENFSLHVHNLNSFAPCESFYFGDPSSVNSRKPLHEGDLEKEVRQQNPSPIHQRKEPLEGLCHYFFFSPAVFKNQDFPF